LARASALLALGCTASKKPASASQAGGVDISVDGAASGTPLRSVWAFHGYDEVNVTTQPEGEALLRAIVAMHAAPVHVRNHFLFNTGDGEPSLRWGSTNVYTEDVDGSPVYDWSLTDGILDAITEAGASPFVELGFMPQALSLHPEPYRNASSTALNGGCFYPPTDYAKWAALVGNWASHAADRYSNQASDWPWELWNEPDSAYWHGSFDDYAKLYDYTESALHQALPAAALGGPAVIAADGPFLSQFLQHCATGINAVTGETGTRLDLVTFHAKGGVSVNGDHVEMNLGHQLRLHAAGFSAVAAFSQYRQTPIYITEADPDGCAACPASFIEGAEYRSSTAYGAYELAMMQRTLELETRAGVALGGVLTWAFTYPNTAYFAGYRALASHGINLPVMSAFQLLGRLSGTRLPLTSSGARELDDVLQNGVHAEGDVDAIATRDRAELRVLIWSYHDELRPAAATPVHLTVALADEPGTKLEVSHLRVDESHGDAYSVWRAQGMPESPSAEQLAALERAMVPAALAPDETLTLGDDRTIGVDFELPRFGISLVTIRSDLEGVN
jgi:xylan 1,4-beta-xylosidase